MWKVRSAKCGKYEMWSVEYRKCGVWKMGSVENVGCGNARCEKCGVWKMQKKYKIIIKRKGKNPMLDNLKAENL